MKWLPQPRCTISPDEVRIHFAGRRPLYNAKIQMVTANDQHIVLPVGKSQEVSIGSGSINSKLWVTRGSNWVPTVTSGPGTKKYLQQTNIGENELILRHGVSLGMWMAPDLVPRLPAYVSVGSRRYMEWQTLAYEATDDQPDNFDDVIG